ncbi:MAG: helix-turn-helix domain-containing protein [Kibdelosporangium sp.]
MSRQVAGGSLGEMEGLLLRLSALDADAENAVRVIGFFDRLIARRASLDTIAANATELAECPAGVFSAARGLQVGGPVPASAASRRLEDGTVVWLARQGKSLPLDEIVLERLSIAAAVTLDHSRLPLPSLGDPALVELALSDSAGEADRSRALHLLGLTPSTKIRVLAVNGTPHGLTAALGSLHAVLGRSEDPAPQDGLVGASAYVPAIQAPAAWQAARTAVRFATPAAPVVWAERLGSLAALAGLADFDVPDVRALDRLADEPGMLDLLAAVCETTSIRQAAAKIHRHHSTIPPRLEHAQAVLDFALDTPNGRFRLHLALVLRRLRDNG